jgi:lipopolysaccharide export LptBFGC system permease protein LptF
MLATQLQGNLAAPFTCLVVVLIALPFGMRTGRRNVFVGVAASIFICFGYFILQRITFGLGVGRSLSPVLAAWLPNIVSGGTALVLLARQR